MNAENFCYWLQGSLELGHTEYLDANDIQIIQDHLNLVFKKETPELNKPKTNDEVVKELTDKFKDSPPVGSAISPRPYIGVPPFDYNNQPVITC